jgi:release factor glutamine methyltransferase
MIFGNPIRIDSAVNRIREALRLAGFDDPGKEARLLFEAVTGITIERQIMHPDTDVDAETTACLNEALDMRLRRVSIPQIVGYVWFDGLRIDVNMETLVPRPETEFLVKEAFHYVKNKHVTARRMTTVLDAFTGSGAIGIALGFRCQQENIPLDLTLADVSKEALKVAKKNAERLLPKMCWRIEQTDIWPLEKKAFDVITANPPYVKSDDVAQLMPEVASYEPRIALDGGKDGLLFYKRLAKEGALYLEYDGVLLLEAGAGQADAIVSFFVSEGWSEIDRLCDAAGWERVLVFSRK